MTVDEGNKITK